MEVFILAKYTVKFSCGHFEKIELLGKETERQRKIAYFAENGLCSACYKLHKQAEAQAAGLIFNASILPNIDPTDGSFLLAVWYSGDTISHKDALKSLGYKWGSICTTETMLSAKRSLCWNKIIKANMLSIELEYATSLGATTFRADQKFWNRVDYEMAIRAKKAWEEKFAKMQEIKKPEPPAKIQGHKWNQKIYGKTGGYTIYLNGVKTVLTDDEAAEIKTYLKELKAYTAQIDNL